MNFSPPPLPHGDRILHKRTRLKLVLTTLILSAASAALAQTSPAPETELTTPTVPEPPPPASTPNTQVASPSGLAHDAGLYFTAPLHWNGTEWAWFAGALAAIAGSHHYDTQVYTHFTKGLTPDQIANIKSDDLQDALPSVAVFLATWGFAAWTDDPNGHREAWSMLEAAGLSTVNAYALKFIIRREGPYQTSDPNEWFKSGGRSFPSEHATASFAIGTVLAEAGGDDYRWLRRVLGYGLGIGTSYLRLKHNAHWLSDTVAGGALGIASAQFTLNHAYRNQDSGFALMPVQGGAMLTYHMTLQ